MTKNKHNDIARREFVQEINNCKELLKKLKKGSPIWIDTKKHYDFLAKELKYYDQAHGYSED